MKPLLVLSLLLSLLNACDKPDAKSPAIVDDRDHALSATAVASSSNLPPGKLAPSDTSFTEGCDYVEQRPSPGGFVPTFGKAHSLPGTELNESIDACHRTACTAGFTIQLNSEMSPMKDGQYVIRAKAPHGELTCRKRVKTVRWIAPPHCSKPGHPAAGISHDCVAPNADSFESLYYQADPSQVTVTIERDGTPIASKTFFPKYSDLRHDGYECPKQCRHAPLAAINFK